MMIKLVINIIEVQPLVNKKLRLSFVLMGAAISIFMGWFSIRNQLIVQAEDLHQQPSPNIPTVTGTPSDPMGKVVLDQEEINVRSGPGAGDVFPRIGVLLPGQDVPVLGRSPGGDWLQIYYPGVPGNVGWVYYAFIVLPQDMKTKLKIIEPPSTPTPIVTPTIDATLAAQFIVNVPPTRLPTFTPPRPIIVPTYVQEEKNILITDIPMGLPISILLIMGILGLLISILRD
jgi:hypothetical protein